MAAGFEQLFGPADDGFHPGDDPWQTEGGGVTEAVNKARQLARIPDNEPVRFKHFPKQQSPFEALSEMFGVQSEAAQALVMLGGVMADPQAQAVMRRIEGERMRSEGAVVLAVCYAIVRFVHLGFYAYAARSANDAGLMRQLGRFGVVTGISVALMLAVVWDLGRAALPDALTAGLGLVSTAVLFKTKLNPTWLVLAGAVIGLLRG